MMGKRRSDNSPHAVTLLIPVAPHNLVFPFQELDRTLVDPPFVRKPSPALSLSLKAKGFNLSRRQVGPQGRKQKSASPAPGALRPTRPRESPLLPNTAARVQHRPVVPASGSTLLRPGIGHSQP